MVLLIPTQQTRPQNRYLCAVVLATRDERRRGERQVSMERERKLRKFSRTHKKNTQKTDTTHEIRGMLVYVKLCVVRVVGEQVALFVCETNMLW